MSHHPHLSQVVSRAFVAWVIAAIVASTLPPQASQPAMQRASSPRVSSLGPARAEAATSAPPDAARANDPAPSLGALRFAPVVDSDDNPASNPTAGRPAPVHRVGAPPSALATEDDDAARYAVIALAVEVTPDDAARNPAGAMVEFELWDDAGQVRLTRQARADAWGAASTEFFLDDLHLAGQFHYIARAEGYGETPPRSFVFDSTSYASDVWLGAARVTTTVEADGRLVADVESDAAIDDSLLAVQLTAVRLLPTPSGAPDTVLLPPLAAQRLDDHHARAEIYLEAGDYLLSASAQSGAVEARSQPVYVHIDAAAAPPIAAVEDLLEFSDDGATVLVQYRTPDGDAALLRRSVADLPAEPPAPATPPLFQERTRISPFQWRTQVYSTTVETVVDDGKKLATLDGFRYDPIARSYDIKIESLMDRPVEDKLTVQVFGPNRVVIYEETVPIWLDPAQPFHYQFSLPSDRGEPTGLRIHVHDPLDFDWALQLISDAVTTVYTTLDAAVNTNREGFVLTAGFGFSLKVVEIDVITASISCASGECKPKAPTGIFFGVDPWLGVVTDGVKTFLRNQYRDILATDDMDAILKKLGEGINLGSLTLSATASARYIYTLIDPGSCVNAQALEQAKKYVADLGFAAKDLGDTITFRAKTLSESLQSKGKINLTIPGAWFLGAQLSPVLAFKLKGDKSGDYAVYGELQVELGGKATLKLKASAIFDTIFALLAAKEYVIGIYRILDIARTGQKLFTMISSASAFAAGGGCSAPKGGGSGGGKKGPNPPPPNGTPDDRIDAVQSQFSLDPRGISGDIQTLQQQVAAAQAAGLSRAATYFTVQLRRQELAAFELDTSRTISHTAEMEAVYDQAYLRITGLISGTILPEPGQTITDAVRSAYAGYLGAVGNTPYSQERRARLDSLEFAQRQYSLLRGQELELQHELSEMLRVGGVGVVDSGLVRDALGAIGSLGVRAVPLELVAGSGSSDLSTSRYLPPYLAPSVMIVPSGGLYRFQQSQQARAWLETYVAIGGTLVVLAQFDSDDWPMLPGGQLRGLGYEQDILCKNASVSIINSSPWIVGIGRDRPDIQIDGSFTAWPADATLLLMRTTGNLMPAMLEYPYGLGTVVATAAYPDFYMNGLQSDEDIIFARGLFGQAYLQATGEALAANVAPNQATSISVDVTNTSALTVTQVTLYRDFYASNIGESWRWAVHQPNPYAASQIVTVNPPLPSGASRSVTFSFAAPPQAGIHRLAYFLGAQAFDFYHWNLTGANVGPFYQVQSAAVKTDLFRFQLTPDQTAYDYGAQATLTAALRNDRSTARTFTLQPLSGLSAAPVVVTVAPHSTETRTFTTTVNRTRQVRMAAVENGNTVSELAATLRLKLPTLGLSGTPEEVLAGVAASGIYTAAVSNAPVGTATVDWEVRQDGVLLQSTSTPLVGTVGSSLAQLAVSLPAAAPDAEFTVAAALPNTSRVMTQTIPVLKPAEIRSALLARSPIIDDGNADALLVGLQDPGHPGQYSLQAQLRRGNTVLSSGPVVSGSLGAGFGVEALDLTLPPTLTLGMTYTVALSLTGQFTGAAASYPDSYDLPLVVAAPQVTLANATRRAGQPLDLTIRSLPDEVSLPAAGPFDLLLVGVSTYAYEPLPIESSTPLPNSAGVTLHTHVPNYLYSGGLYDVQVTSPRLVGWQGHASLTVAPHRIEMEAPSAVSAGNVLTITLQNTGGVTATVSGNLTLADRRTATVAETSFYRTVPANGSAPLTLPVPAQLRTDPYSLRIDGTDQLSQAFTRRRVVTVQGLQVELDSRTEQPAYLASDTITATSTITPNTALAGAALRLRVLNTPPPSPAWDGWRARLADGGRSNHVQQTATGPFEPSWNASSSTTGVAPVAIGDLVFVVDATCANPRVKALDSLDGSVRWQSARLPNFPSALAANAQYVYVYIYPSCPSSPDRQPDALRSPATVSDLLALDAATGALIWQVSLTTSGRFLASDQAVAIQDYDNDGFRLLDPATGNMRAILSGVYDPLLVDGVLYTVDDTDQLAAYDATTGNLLWSVPALPESDLLAANAAFVLTFQPYDPITFSTVNRLSVFTSDGVHLGNVPLSHDAYVPYIVLDDDTLFYLYVEISGGTRSPETPDDIVSTVYAVDLAGLTQTVWYESEDEFSALAGTGDRLHLFASYPRRLITLDNTGAVVTQTDFASLPGYYYDGLTVYQHGLLLLYYGGYYVYALQGSGPVSDDAAKGRAIESTAALREEWLPVGGGGVLTLPLAFTNPNLPDDPRARGLLYLEAVLFGAEPAAAQPAERQPLASSVYPFTIDNALSSVTLRSDRPIYRRNVPGYAADDALAAVSLDGQVRNTGLTSADIDLEIQRSDGATVLSQTFSAVAPNDTRPFSVVDPAPPQGSVAYTATTSLGHAAVAAIEVRPAQVGATTSLAPASIALGESTTLTVDLANLGTQPGFVTVDLGAGAQDVVLAAGESASLAREITPATAGALNLPVVFSGDISRTDTPQLTVRDESATASIVLSGAVRSLVEAGGRAPSSPALVQGANAGIDFVLNNNGATSFDAAIDYTLTGPEPRAGSELATLPPGATTVHVALGALAVGDYTVDVAVRHARLGSVIAAASLSFSVVSPIYGLAVTAETGEMDAGGAVVISVIVTSTAASEQPWMGTLVVEEDGNAVRREPVVLPPGASASYTGTLNLRDRAGPQQLHTALIDADGTTLAEHDLALDGPPRLAPAARLISLTASAGSPGGPVTLTATVDNDGPAGDAPLSFLAFDQTSEVTAALPAHGQRAVALIVTAPAGLLAGSYPAEVHLGDEAAKTDITLSGAQIDVTQALNAASYQPFSPATWTVSLHGVSGGPASYDVALRYVTQSYTQTVTLGAGQTVHVPWTFDVGPASNRASVIVQPHISDSTTARHALIIDSRWVPVIEDPFAWLESDKYSYQAGETVHLTMHLLRPTDAAYVLAPGEIAAEGSPLLWTNLSMTSTYTITNPYTVGDFPIDYPLPATLRTGRYHFVYAYDSEERTLPIDVHGVTLFTEDFAVAGPTPGAPLLPGDPLTLTARLRLDAPLASATLLAYALAPDGTPVGLGPLATQTTGLPAGETPVVLHGVLPVSVESPSAALLPGAYRITFQVQDPTTLAVLGGDAAFVDVGSAAISSLTTDHGVYTQNQPGAGTLVAYGVDTANIHVETSGGTVLLDQNASLSGFQAFNFALPTAILGDEVLIGTVTDSHGLVSALQGAYKVANTFDVTAPEVKIVSPANGARAPLPPNHQITVSGVFTEETDIDTVLVNGDPALLSGNSWTATVTATLGSNLIQAVALDAAGNASAPDLADVFGEPDFAIDFTVTPTSTAVNGLVSYTAVVTASEAMTVTVLFPFSVKAVAPSNGSASSGQLDLDVPVSWEGVVTPGQPVTIQWQGAATEPISRTISSLAQGDQIMPRFSQDVQTLITTAPLAILLDSFDAQPVGSRILVTWETVSEIGNAGFNLYRTGAASSQPTDGDLLAFIPSATPGGGQGAFYQWSDTEVEAGVTYWYWLQTVGLDGQTAMYGPVSATAQTPTAVRLTRFTAAGQARAERWPFSLVVVGFALLVEGWLIVRRRRRESEQQLSSD